MGGRDLGLIYGLGLRALLPPVQTGVLYHLVGVYLFLPLTP